MKRTIFNLSYCIVITVLLASCGSSDTNNKRVPDSLPTLSSNIASIQELLQSSNSTEVLVVAHRGDWRNAPENSLQAIENCIKMGVDIVEIDVRLTKDSIPVLMHDSKLDRTTTGKGKISEWTLDSLKTLTLRNGCGIATGHRIPTLEEALNLCKGRIMVNLDKSYPIFSTIFPVILKTGTADHIIMKGKVSYDELQADFHRYLDTILFMPLIDIEKEESSQILADYQSKMQPIAYEFVFDTEKSPIISEFGALREQGARIWVNTLWGDICAYRHDDKALDNPEEIYGWLINKKVNIIQTDRPQFLLDYLRSKNLHK